MRDETSNAHTDIGGGAGFLLWQAGNGWQRVVRAALAPVQLTFVQYVLLAGLEERLADSPTVSQAALAERLAMDAMMASQVLRTLESLGLIARARSKQDTRMLLLELTQEGRQRIAKARPLFEAAERRFFEVLGRKEGGFLKRVRKLWRQKDAGGHDDD